MQKNLYDILIQTAASSHENGRCRVQPTPEPVGGRHTRHTFQSRSLDGTADANAALLQLGHNLVVAELDRQVQRVLALQAANCRAVVLLADCCVASAPVVVVP